jgi:hypothetical protein
MLSGGTAAGMLNPNDGKQKGGCEAVPLALNALDESASGLRDGNP